MSLKLYIFQKQQFVPTISDLGNFISHLLESEIIKPKAIQSAPIFSLVNGNQKE